LLTTARTYFVTKYPSRLQPDPINIHVQFILPVPIGPARLRVDEISIARRYSVIQITLQTQQLKSGTQNTCIIAIVTQGNLATESGQTVPTPPLVPRSVIPDRETACEEWVQPEWLARLLPVGAKMTTLLPKGGTNMRFPSRKGLNFREVWMKWTDEKERFDLISLGSV
jgi:hypothetical protein